MRVTALLLSLMLASPALAQNLIECNADGKRVAKKEVGTLGSGIGGFAGGLLLGLIGTGLAVVVQSEPEVPSHLLPEGDECSYAFQQGYVSEGRGQKRSAALAGGIAGTAILVLVLVISQSAD